MSHKFTEVTVSDTSFPGTAQFDFTDVPNAGSPCGLMMVLKSGVTVEYSFDGATKHGELVPDSPSAAKVFDHLSELRKVWFRAASSSMVAVEGFVQ